MECVRPSLHLISDRNFDRKWILSASANLFARFIYYYTRFKLHSFRSKDDFDKDEIDRLIRLRGLPVDYLSQENWQ